MKPSNAIHRHTSRKGYDTPAGKQPGVTTVLNATKTQESKDRLQAWLRRPGNPEYGKARAQSGTWSHSLAENWLAARAGHPPIHPNLPAGVMLSAGAYYRSLERFLEAHVHSPLGVELPVWHPDGYAGTSDAVLWTFDDPEAVLIDWKTADRPKSDDILHDYCVQVAAYRKAIEHTYGMRLERAYVVIGIPACFPQVEALDAHQLDELEAEWDERLELFKQGCR